jgi:hypothetical protein
MGFDGRSPKKAGRERWEMISAPCSLLRSAIKEGRETG